MPSTQPSSVLSPCDIGPANAAVFSEALTSKTPHGLLSGIGIPFEQRPIIGLSRPFRLGSNHPSGEVLEGI